MKTVTEQDFRKDEFKDAKVEDYEFRHDGKLVRKDRWETAVRRIASALGCTDWEVEDVVNAADSAVTQSDMTTLINLSGPAGEIVIGRVFSENDFFVRIGTYCERAETVVEAVRAVLQEVQP